MKVYLMGFMGAGKTYWGEKLSHSLQLKLFDLDREIVKREKANIPAIFEQYGESHFRSLEHKYLKILSEEDDVVIACGGGTPCFSDNMSLMNQKGLTVWLNVPIEVMVSRLKNNKCKRPLIAGKDEEQLYTFVQNKLKERTRFYKQAHLIVNPIQYTLESLTKKIQSCEKLI